MREIFKFVGVVVLTVTVAVVVVYFQNQNLEETYKKTDWIIPVDSE